MIEGLEVLLVVYTFEDDDVLLLQRGITEGEEPATEEDTDEDNGGL